MKKLNTSILLFNLIVYCFLFLNPASVSAINYYQTYDIVVTGSTNSIQCQVYDYDLQQTMTWSSGSVSNIQYQNQDGVVLYYGTSTIGYVTYDLELHQFQSWSSSYTGPFTVSNKDGVTSFTSSYTIGVGIYDINLHQWQTWNSSYTGPFQLSNSDGIASFASANSVGCLIYDPSLHQWQSYISAYTGPFQISSKDGTFAFAGNSSVGCLAYDPQLQQWQSWISSYTGPFNLVNDKGLVVFSSSSTVGVLTYDPVSLQWMSYISSYTGPFTILSSGRVAAFAGASTIGAITYDPNQHQFSTYTNSVTIMPGSLAISNGTVTYQSSGGTGYSIGYQGGGWSSGSVTAMVTAFTLYNFNTVQNPIPLIHVRNMSIGATNIQYDFGDGIIANQSCLYHLYKVNGHYYRPSSIYNVCMTASNNGGSLNTCQQAAINYTTSLPESGYPEVGFLSPALVHDFTTIHLPDGVFANGELVVVDVTGRTISRNQINAKNVIEIKATNLPAGIYLVKVEGIGTYRFVKE